MQQQMEQPPWSGKWKRNDFKINGKDSWSRKYWKELYKASENIKIHVTCVSAHQKDNTEVMKYNNEVDALTGITKATETKRIKIKV